jgi:hypothetical protein
MATASLDGVLYSLFRSEISEAATSAGHLDHIVCARESTGRGSLSAEI